MAAAAWLICALAAAEDGITEGGGRCEQTEIITHIYYPNGEKKIGMAEKELAKTKFKCLSNLSTNFGRIIGKQNSMPAADCECQFSWNS